MDDNLTDTRVDAGLVRRVALFAPLPEDEIRLLAAALRCRAFPAGALLFEEDAPGDRLTILLDGAVQVIKGLGMPDERVLSVVGANACLGEMSLLSPGGRRYACARALQPTTVLELGQNDFNRLVQRRPRLALEVLRQLMLRMRDAEDAAIADLRVQNAELAGAYRDLQDAQARLFENERMENELGMARRIQESMLPRELPLLPGWRVLAHWQPAHEVSGDFYDFFDLPGGRLGIAVGDVSDKGVPAAIVMAITRSILRASTCPDDAPADVLRRANDQLCAQTPDNMFVTCLYAVLDPSDGRLVFANAGHCLPIRKRGEQAVELMARGMPLGMAPGMTYEQNEARIEPGDCLFLYTDGLAEARDTQGAFFGFKQVREQARACESGSALIGHMLERLAQFLPPGSEPDDDVTLVTLERL